MVEKVRVDFGHTEVQRSLRGAKENNPPTDRLSPTDKAFFLFIRWHSSIGWGKRFQNFILSVSAIWLISVFFIGTSVGAQELPNDELQVTLNSYFDNFNVKIFYPTVSFAKSFSDSSTINFRYLVDIISAASMRSHFAVDGVTSATTKEDGGGDDKPDELRQEVALGVNEVLNGGVLNGGGIALNGLYSKEHDYSSFTVAGMITFPLAKKNTTLQFGTVRSWDKSFPQIRTWKKKKDVRSHSFSITQVLNQRLISQLILSYDKSTGYMADPYQVVQIIDGDAIVNHEPVNPDTRVRKAIGLRVNYKTGRVAALNLALRYYWDSWEVNSLTISAMYQLHLSNGIIAGLGIRNYQQSKAFFFKDQYLAPETYMTVDTKLDEGYSNDYQLKLSVNGGRLKGVPLLADENLQINFQLDFYHRHSDTPDWHSRYKNLYAYILSFGVRYRF